MKISKLILIAFFVINASSIFAQDPEVSKVKWMSLTEAMEKVKTDPRPVLIDFYTDWCGWCKTMMKTTYSDDNLANYVNQYFYPVKFDAEGKDTVEYLGKKYGPTSTAPRTPHELAVKLLSGKLMYPTTLFLNGYNKDKKEFAMNMLAAGYLDLAKIQPVLIFTLENAFRNASIDDFTTGFNKANSDTSINTKLETMKWMSPVKAFADSTGKKHKTLVYISAQWCNSCKVMKMTSFTDSININYLTKTFNLVDFNAEITDTISYKGQKYMNPHTPQQNFHGLAFALAKNNVAFPSMVILDENMNYIDVIPGYEAPDLLHTITHFYGDDIYKKKSWADYYKEITDKKQNSK